MTTLAVSEAFAVVVTPDAGRFELMAGLLQRAGLQAVPFTTAETALAALQSGPPPALIVVELNMPGVDGWRFCRWLRSTARQAGPRIPIIIVANFLITDHLQYIATEPGADAFLTLPQDAEEFVAQAQALRQGQPASTRPTLLILSADAEYTAQLAQTCRAQGYQADTATTVREALEYCAGADCQWAVLDEELLDGPGAALLEQIHARLPDCLCIILAADPAPEKALRWMKQGAWAWLRKPCAPEQVLQGYAHARRERAILEAERRWQTHTAELHKQRQRLEHILQGTRAGTWEWNVQTGETIFNERWADIVGCTLAELAPVSIRTWEKLAHPEDLQRSNELLARHFAGELPYYECECRLRHKDGRWVWVLDRGQVMTRTPDGRPEWMYGTHLDITQRKQAEAALLQRTEGQARLLEVTKTLAGTLDLQTVSQAAVDGGSRLLGLGSAAIYLREGDWLELLAASPPLPPDLLEYFRRSALADHPRVQEALATGRPVLVPDITKVELGQEERAIIETRQLRTLLFLPLTAGSQTLGVLILGSVKEPQPVSEAQIDLGIALANLVALAVANARLYASVQQHAADLERQMAERKRAEAEKEKLQAQLLQAQKMESVGRLAGGVAHDFNNMLQAILGHTALVLEDLPPDSPLRESLLEIQACAQRSADLTRQLLGFARKQTIAPKPLNLNDTVGGMLKMLRRLIGEDIDLIWAPGPDVGLVQMDPAQVDQILANLCVNARDAIGNRHGKITIETTQVAFDAAYVAAHPEARVGCFVRLAVSDDGCGMTPEVKAHLFEPFFTTKELGQGTGLGLATIYGIVKQNDGFINVYSEPGQGTTVQIHLPIYSVDHAPPPAPEAASQPTRGQETILLVEDEPAILRVTQRALERLGYRVLTARAPGEALQLAREHPGQIHLLITDVIMPEMNGRELAGRLLGLHPNLKRLFMSGYTANVIAHHGVLDPGVHFLQKPYTTRTLAAKVREILDE